MDNQKRREAKEISKTPAAMLEYLWTPRWRSLSALILVVIFAVIAAVFMINSNSEYSAIRQDLERNESLWASSGISDYEYLLSASNENGGTSLAVIVKDGQAISKTLQSNYRGEPGLPVPLDIGTSYTVPDLFNRIYKALEDREQTAVVELLLRYNADYGYPEYIGLGPREYFHESLYEYQVRDFKILEPEEDKYARLAAELDKHEKLWETRGTENYQYTLILRKSKDYTQNGEEYSIADVTVKNGVAGITGGITAIPPEAESLDTVPELFDRIRRAITEKEEEGFNRLTVSYDDEYGFPTYITLRDPYLKGDPGVYSYSVTGFEFTE